MGYDLEGLRPMRPSVDIISPSAGSDDTLASLARRLASLSLSSNDAIYIAVNRVSPAPQSLIREFSDSVHWVHVSDLASSYHARNQAAAKGSGEWLLFLDDDCDPDESIVDDYFAHPLSSSTAVVAGSIFAARRPELSPTLLERYAISRGLVEHRGTLAGEVPYAQTANCLVRRTAWSSVNGFAKVRSGGDADLCFRLFDVGWKLDVADATVRHWGRGSLIGALRKSFRWGIGWGWLTKQSNNSKLSEPVMVSDAIPTERRPIRARISRLRSRGSKSVIEEAVFRIIDIALDVSFQFGVRCLPWLNSRLHKPG